MKKHTTWNRYLFYMSPLFFHLFHLFIFCGGLLLVVDDKWDKAKWSCKDYIACDDFSKHLATSLVDARKGRLES